MVINPGIDLYICFRFDQNICKHSKDNVSIMFLSQKIYFFPKSRFFQKYEKEKFS